MLHNQTPQHPQRIARQLKLAEQIRIAMVQDHPRVQALFKMTASPLPQVSEWAFAQLEEFLVRPLALSMIPSGEGVPRYDGDPAEAICLGRHAETGAPILIHRDRLTENLLVIGSIGSGKTQYLFWLMDQLVQQSVPIKLIDFKGESARLINRYA